jgi:hypothetical protein
MAFLEPACKKKGRAVVRGAPPQVADCCILPIVRCQASKWQAVGAVQTAWPQRGRGWVQPRWEYMMVVPSLISSEGLHRETSMRLMQVELSEGEISAID